VNSIGADVLIINCQIYVVFSRVRKLYIEYIHHYICGHIVYRGRYLSAKGRDNLVSIVIYKGYSERMPAHLASVKCYSCDIYTVGMNTWKLPGVNIIKNTQYVQIACSGDIRGFTQK
jgi:hypothetical protein